MTSLSSPAKSNHSLVKPAGDQSLTTLRGVGPRVLERLRVLDIETTQDLLFHLPLRYEDRTRVTAIGRLAVGTDATVVGDVLSSQVTYGRRRSLLCQIEDGTGRLQLRFFHFSASQKNRLQPGSKVQCFGEVRRGPHGFELVHPEYRVLSPSEEPTLCDHLTPVYPTTDGMAQASFRNLIQQALNLLRDGHVLTEYLPSEVLHSLRFPTLSEALIRVHQPPRETTPVGQLSRGHAARRRLAFEELLAHHLSLRQLRQKLRQVVAPRIVSNGHITRTFIRSLGFSLTGAQTRVIEQIHADLDRPSPMHRLIQGDVGCGKTVVAAVAALSCIQAGHQVAFMAPTELLAEQHLATFAAWCRPLGVEIAWLSGRLTPKQRRMVLQTIAQPAPLLVIGTHALFQDDVNFANLALVIVDEQHRFGVHQRLALQEKGLSSGERPHQMIMTATPIPRTLAMAAYADLDTSVIDELPPGRQSVDTAVISESRRDEVIRRVHEACNQGQQAYWVCTLIEESETLQCQAADDTAKALGQLLANLRIGLVHGRMKSADKERVMAAFKASEIDVLVATTVIEVGVDVPNASLMIIENAERLGLAQLHQLRGRVGRGRTKSACVMMYQPPLSRTARARLNVLRETNDGFLLAQRDLEIRGPGEVLGTRQTGETSMRIADLVADAGLWPGVELASEKLITAYPERVPPLVRRWLGNAEKYGAV